MLRELTGVMTRFVGVLAAVLAVAAASCGRPQGGMVVGSAHLQAMTLELTGGRVQARNLIPPAMCPGHFDMRPGDIEALRGDAVLLLQPWQLRMPNVRGLLEASGIPSERIRVIDVDGNWMAPPVYFEALGAVAEALAELEPAEAETYRARARERRHAAEAFAEALRGRIDAAGLAGVKVACNEMQADLARWAGLDVVATFGRAEDMSVAAVADLSQRIKDSGATLVVDNLQSGDPKTGAALARDAGVAHVVLSNFPGGLEGTETWERALERNIELLLGAARERRGGDG